MTASDLDVRDAGADLVPEPARVVAELFLPGESTPGSTSRTERVVQRVLSAPREQIEASAALLIREFAARHDGIAEIFRANAAKVHPEVDRLDPVTAQVLGATVTAEYAIEGAALCNPSAVADPDQSGVPAGALRVIVALRSIGEGHVSSISFASALIGPGRTWTFEERRLPLARAAITDGAWDRDHLRVALQNDGQLTEVAHAVIQKLPSSVRKTDLERVIRALPEEFFSHYDSRARVEAIRVVSRSAYDAQFAAGSAVSQRVLMPVADEERHGMEDARFVRFVDDDGSVVYRGTYTAYDGRAISSRMIVTADFRRFAIGRLTGPPARTKGMALFPRRIGGRLYALTRSGGEAISLAASDDGFDWRDEAVIHVPQVLWEVVQSGNCGPPIETDRGWLVLTHGVGPMRRYAMGAMLLDLDDPRTVVGSLPTPLLEPDGARQDGYVPHVVYSCGALVHDGMLWVPYGVGDARVSVASVPLDDLLATMSAPADASAGGGADRRTPPTP